MSVKSRIIEVCDAMIAFWDGFEKEIEQIPAENVEQIIFEMVQLLPRTS